MGCTLSTCYLLNMEFWTTNIFPGTKSYQLQVQWPITACPRLSPALFKAKLHQCSDWKKLLTPCSVLQWLWLCIALSLHAVLSLGAIYISICRSRVEAISKISHDVRIRQEWGYKGEVILGIHNVQNTIAFSASGPFCNILTIKGALK